MNERLVAELNAALEFFNRSTGSLTEEDSDYTPVDGVFSTAQQVAHAAQTIDWFIDGAFGPSGFDMDFEAHERKVRGVTSLSDARAWLARSVENARGVIESKTPEEWAQPLSEGPVMGGQPACGDLWSDHRPHRASPWRADGLRQTQGQGPPDAIYVS